VQIQEGKEPPEFTTHFAAWDSNVHVQSTASYNKRVADRKAKQTAGAPATESAPSAPVEEAPPAAVETPAEAEPSSAVEPPPEVEAEAAIECGSNLPCPIQP
jgi:hypothetical protein